MIEKNVPTSGGKGASSGGRLGLSVAICTKDRPEVLRETLETLWRQSRLPDELVVIDDGRLDVGPVAEAALAKGVAFVYHNKSDRPGLALSRRAAVEKSSREIILFLDDDVLLDKSYIAAIMDVFEADTERRIGGCTGVLKGFCYRPFQMALLRLFAMDDPRREGRMLKNFLGVLVRDIEQPTEVEWLPGCNMAYRREALEGVEIPTYLEHYSAGEDRVISYQVGRRWRLVATPAARLVHRRVPASRIGGRARGFQEIFYNYLHFRRFMPQDFAHRAAFARLCLGYLVINALRLDWRRLIGNLEGIGAIVTGGAGKIPGLEKSGASVESSEK